MKSRSSSRGFISRVKNFRLFILAVMLFVFAASLLLNTSFLVHKDGYVVVSEGETRESVASSLRGEGFVDGKLAFLALYAVRYGFGIVKPGGYEITEDMSLWDVIKQFRGEPYLRWVTIQEGLRKEEIALLLKERLDWDEGKIKEFMSFKLEEEGGLSEGMFYPDTYLLPVSENGEDIAKRLVRRFNEQVGPLYKLSLEENIKHDTALKLASIIQREAAGPHDMPLVSGILWNRLLRNMRLEVDATVQYARGDSGRGFWAPISLKDKDTFSPFNTYKYYGLPPQPISNPGIDAIRAAIKPEATKCLYYIHDSNRQIHCSPTYAEHLIKIKQYL